MAALKRRYCSYRTSHAARALSGQECIAYWDDKRNAADMMAEVDTSQDGDLSTQFEVQLLHILARFQAP